MIGDTAFRAELAEALHAAAELCFVVLWAQGGGRKDWYVARDVAALETVLARIRPTGPHGYSDRIEVFATGELPYRTADDDEWLYARALQVLEEHGELVLACRRDGDPELHDVDGAAEIAAIDEWFSEPHEGERLVGAHPFRHFEGTPGVFVAYNPNDDGEIRPGAY